MISLLLLVSSLTHRRMSLASPVNSPCLKALLFPRGAPDPGAPPCMRHLAFPATAGDRQGAPCRVFAPQRGLLSIGAVLRSCPAAIALYLRDHQVGICLAKTRSVQHGLGLHLCLSNVELRVMLDTRRTLRNACLHVSNDCLSTFSHIHLLY